MAGDSRGEGFNPLSRRSSIGGCRHVFPVTLLDNPPAEAAYVIQENFGPLREVIKSQDLDEAVRLANGTPYGLGASGNKSHMSVVR
jgi:acyl-CoA reductase-like NAD-dependent aldehyde dehydrogenase